MRDTLWNPADTVESLQENVAIAAAHVKNAEGKYIFSPITIEQAVQIGTYLWWAGYRKTADVITWKVQL